MTRKEKSI